MTDDLWENCKLCQEFITSSSQDNTVIWLHCKLGQNMLDKDCKMFRGWS